MTTIGLYVMFCRVEAAVWRDNRDQCQLPDTTGTTGTGHQSSVGDHQTMTSFSCSIQLTHSHVTLQLCYSSSIVSENKQAK